MPDSGYDRLCERSRDVDPERPAARSELERRLAASAAGQFDLDAMNFSDWRLCQFTEVDMRKHKCILPTIIVATLLSTSMLHAR